MGDSGSTFLGLAIASIGIFLSQGGAAVISPPIGLWLIAVPVFDLFSAVVRRMVQRKSPFAPDHEHLHHALIVAGLSRRETLVVMLGMAIVFSGVGLIGRAAQVADGVMVFLWLGANVVYYQVMRHSEPLVRCVHTVRRIRLRRGRVGSA